MLGKLRAFVSRRQREREFEEEIEHHVRLLEQRLIGQGMTPVEARSQAVANTRFAFDGNARCG